MKGSMMAFILWILIGAGFVIWGIAVLFAKKEKPFGFWANAEVFPVKDVVAYNKALGTMFLSVFMMVIYVTRIERKYRKR